MIFLILHLDFESIFIQNNFKMFIGLMNHYKSSLIIILIFNCFHLMIFYKMYYFNDYIIGFFKKNLNLKCFPISLKFFINLVPILSKFIFIHFIFIMIHFLNSNRQYF